MNTLTKYYFSLLLIMQCVAQPANALLPSNLVKVTKENNPNCIEYVIYQTELYCSLTAIDTTPIDPKILSYEKQQIVFDNRGWKAAWGKQEQSGNTVEYLPLGEDINHWNELVTSQFFPGLAEIRADQFGDQIVNDLHKSGLSFTINPLENQPNLLIFEFKVQKPDNLQQDEIVKIVKGKEGMYVLHYAIKQSDMSDDNRKKWLENLKKSTLKDSL